MRSEPTHPVWSRIAAVSNAPGSWPMSPEEWDRRACEKLPQGPLGFIQGGAGRLDTVDENRAAFDRWRLVPRMLGSAVERDLSVRICGRTFPSPIFLAPIGAQSIAHEEAELAVARAADRCGVTLMVATPSTFSLEEIAAAGPGTDKWFQLYFVNDREIVESLVHRAEAAGYASVTVTVDTPMLGWRERDLGNQRYLPFREGAGLGSFHSDPVFRKKLGCDPTENLDRSVALFLALFNSEANFALRWSDMRWLRSITRVPLFIKGVLSESDARKALEIGFDGIVVSNHGGRQVDGAIASLDALVNIRKAIGREPLLMMDGGVRRGSDVIKAMALGADAVLIGRPFMHGLALGGQDGVEAVLLNLLADTHRTLGLCGYPSIHALDPSVVVRRP